MVKADCKYFKGDIPCKPHKKHGYHCADCLEYLPLKKSILIIKLGAAGDVIRTSVILPDLRKEFPDAEINWLTDYPILVPKDYVDNVILWDFKNVLWLESRKFDLLINLDKDRHALALASKIFSIEKRGYLPDRFGKCSPANLDAMHKFKTGIWDDLSLENRKSYPQEIIEMMGYEYNFQPYILDLPKAKMRFNLPEKKKIIGLNTGCGTRWLTRLWGKRNWIDLSDKLTNKGYYPLLLGGDSEDELNQTISANSSANYLGTFKMVNFLNLMHECDLVVTSVTMAMHIALGYDKKLVLLNNIFNKNEFELYGMGEILEPLGKRCLGCYKNNCEEECMSTISVDRVFESIERLLEI